MAKWVLEPGHTAAEFSARHMMVTNVRGHFKNVRGAITFDPANRRDASVEVTIDAAGIWTGEPGRLRCNHDNQPARLRAELERASREGRGRCRQCHRDHNRRRGDPGKSLSAVLSLNTIRNPARSFCSPPVPLLATFSGCSISR